MLKYIAANNVSFIESVAYLKNMYKYSNTSDLLQVIKKLQLNF